MTTRLRHLQLREKPLSKKKQCKMARLTVAKLKQLVKKLEVVEWTDVTAANQWLLLHLKSYRNAIPIPLHWSVKRDYLQGKGGIEKPPFQLPSYIADIGIAAMRDAVKEKEVGMSLKTKTGERVQERGYSRRWARWILIISCMTCSSSSRRNRSSLALAKCKSFLFICLFCSRSVNSFPS
jgi:hypothetical protein